MKRNILKIMTLFTVAVLALASCKKDNKPQANVPENGFLATVEANHGNGGRTHLVGTEVQWNAGDQIAVRNGNGTSTTFSLSAGENTMNGTFLSSQSGDDFFQPTYTAVYPATGNSITGEGTATFTLPATQSYVANSFANGAMPMMAVSDEQTLEFKNALGGICFPMTGSQTVTRLVLTSNNTADHLSGVFTADYNNGEPTLTCTTGNGNSITLDCGEGVALDATTATDFIIMVPAGSLANGFKLEAYNGEEKVFEKTNDANLGESFIPRSVIMKVNHNLEVVVPTLAVTTISPSFITTNSALGMGIVDETPASCGILYALASDMAVPADELVIDGNNVTDLQSSAVTNETGIRFDANLTGLVSDVQYYVRAYAVDEEGRVNYGDPVLFATRYDYYGLNYGKGRHPFTVREDGTQVYFAMGNLQYQATTNTWRFADYQFEFVGDGEYGLVYEGGVKCQNSLISQNYSGWIDLFGWGTSGISNGATYYQPWSTSTEYNKYNPYGRSDTNLNDRTGMADWGYNAISNSYNTQNSGWRTLQAYNNETNTHEWKYMSQERSCDYKYAHVLLYLRGTSSDEISQVNGETACGMMIGGMIFFPDDFPSELITRMDLKRCNYSRQYYRNNPLTESQWSLLEQAGAIFLPGCCGVRDINGTGVRIDASDRGGCAYWSASHVISDNAVRVDIREGGTYATMHFSPSSNNLRHHGESVRLVYPAN